MLVTARPLGRESGSDSQNRETHYLWRRVDTYVLYTLYMLDIFTSPNFRGFVSKTWGLFFADFNFRGRQCQRKLILILFRKNRRVDGTTRLSLDWSIVRKENLRPKYLKRNGIKDTCSLTDKQTKRTYLHSDGWIKWLFRTKQWNVCLACLLLCVIRHFLP